MGQENERHEIYTMDEPHPTVFKKISKTDVKFSPFYSYKSWTVYSGSATSSLLPLTAIYSDINQLPALGSELTYNDAANIDGSLQTITYFSIDFLVYKYKTQPYNTIGGTDLNRTNKFLYESASILSIPGTKIGDGIKPKSFQFTANTMSLNTDLYGNIYDNSYDSGSIVSDVKLYEGFNEYFDTKRILDPYANITFVPGVPTDTGISQSVGYAAKFDGAGFMSKTIDGYYDRNNDYAVSFWISASNGTSNNQLILGKVASATATQYPFKIELNSSSKIKFTAASNNALQTSITSSGSVNAWTHVVCQKSGSHMQMYVNGVLNSSSSCAAFSIPSSPLTQSGQINNSSSLFLGGFSTNSSNLTGVLDEVRIFNKSLTSANITSLNNRNEADGTFLQTNNVGTIFYKQGLAVISSPHYKYNNVLSMPYTASYRSTKKIYELNVLTRLSAGDFNMSLNPSLTVDNNLTYNTFVSSSEFSPYITTIGLYNDYGQLLAIGKLGQAIKKRDDVDMNFVVRIDLDKPITWKT